MRKAPAYLLALVLFLTAGVQAEQLWVRNQPFPGVVSGSGQNLLVELRTFVHILKLDADDQGDVVLVNGFPIPVQTVGAVRMVPLREIVDAAGLQLSRSPELGTVDVREATAGTGSRGNWEALVSAPTGPGHSDSDGSVTTLTGDAFSVNVPAHLKVVGDPRYLKGEVGENAVRAELNPYGDWQEVKTAFMASTQSGATQGLLTFNLIGGLDAGMTAQEEPEFMDSVRSGVLARGGTPLGGTTVSSVAGKRFHKFQYRQTESDGITYDSEVYVHFSPPNRTAFLILVKAPQKHFHRVAPQLRLVVKNLRVK